MRDVGGETNIEILELTPSRPLSSTTVWSPSCVTTVKIITNTSRCRNSLKEVPRSIYNSPTLHRRSVLTVEAVTKVSCSPSTNIASHISTVFDYRPNPCRRASMPNTAYFVHQHTTAFHCRVFVSRKTKMLPATKIVCK